MISFLALYAAIVAVAGLAMSPAPPPSGDLEGPEPRLTQAAGDPALDVVVAHEADEADEAAEADEAHEAGRMAAAPGAAVESLLETLEASARDLRAFTATIHYETLDALLGEKVIYKGNLVYRVDPASRAKSFAILFDRMIANQRLNDRDTHYIFRDGWLVEIDHENRQFIKRQVVAPGETFDPLKLGEGPIPLPIDQSKDEVLRRFDATLAELPADGPLAKLAGVFEVDGLRLVPRPGTPEAEDFAEITIFYDRVTRLPVGVDAVEPNGNRKTARLGDVRRNPSLDEKTLAQLSIETPEGDWRVDIRPMSR